MEWNQLQPGELDALVRDVEQRKDRNMELLQRNMEFPLRAPNLLRDLIDAAKLAECGCTPRQRMSGHQRECWFLALQDAITAAEEALP